MATNPMQRQARNSFLLGMVITLIVAGVIVALLFMQLKKINQENQNYKSSMIKVYALKQNVNSGDVLTSDMFAQVDAARTAIPSDYADVNTLLSAYSLYTKDGTPITSEYSQENNAQVQHLYINVNNRKTEVLREDSTGSFYIQNGNDKEYLETTEAPVIAKISAKANTVISQSLIARSNEVDTDDVREQEYNMLVLPIDLLTGDYIDIRLQFPNGQDYIVASKKRVTVPEVNGEYLANTIKMKMAEDEILSMSSAIVEAYKVEGSKLYATKYTEAGLQASATPTYVVNNEVANQMDADPNIVDRAKAALSARYNANNGSLKTLREQYINNQLSTHGNEEGYADKVQESITSTQESRQEYLQSLTGTVPTN